MIEFDFPGHELKAQREALGLSLLDAHCETHVPTQYLAGLESGQLDDLPATAFAVGFLTTYCHVLGLQADPYVSALRACRASSVPETKFFSRGGSIGGPAYPAWMSDVVTWGAVCAVLLLGWVAYSIVVKPFAETEKDRVDAGRIEIAPPARFDAE